MLRPMLVLLCSLLPLTSQAASLKTHELEQLLAQVARASSQGTPRAINEDILDQGFQAEGRTLINYLSVRAEHARQMQANPMQYVVSYRPVSVPIPASYACCARARSCAMNSANTAAIAR